MDRVQKKKKRKKKKKKYQVALLRNRTEVPMMQESGSFRDPSPITHPELKNELLTFEARKVLTAIASFVNRLNATHNKCEETFFSFTFPSPISAKKLLSVEATYLCL